MTVSNSPEGEKEQVPESQVTSADIGGAKASTSDEPSKSAVDEDSAYDDLFPEQNSSGQGSAGQSAPAKGQVPSEDQSTQLQQPSCEPQEPQPVKSSNSWPLVRKFEALIFMAMFAAVPLFAVRVIQYTHDQLIVRNVSRELVKDLQRAKTLAVKLQSEVEVSGSASKSAKLFSYVVLIREQVSEEVVLPERVSVVGSITFNKSGLPKKASSFIVSSENRTTTVEIDPTGLVSVPH